MSGRFGLDALLRRSHAVRYEPGKLDLVDDLCLVGWLTKDLSWVLVCAPVCWPAAGVAVAAGTFALIKNFPIMTTGVVVHCLAELLWLIGNCVWMASDLLFSSKSKGLTFSWYDGPEVQGHGEWYTIGSIVSLAIFSSGLLLLLSFYLWSTARFALGRGTSHASEPDEQLVFGTMSMTMYKHIFIGPWILKDIFWTLEWGIPAQVSGVFVLLLVGDCFRRTGGFFFVAEIFWVLGNMIWCWAELNTQDSQGLHITAAVVLALGLLTIVPARAQASLAEQERQPLLKAPLAPPTTTMSS